jgi:hypothetical protein
VVDALSTLEEISQDAVRLADFVERCRTKLVTTELVQPTARAMARAYFEFIRPELLVVKTRAGLIDAIDVTIQALLDLSSESQEKKPYRRHFKELGTYLSEASVSLMKARGERRLLLSSVEGAILDTLARMLPPTAASYEQALRDLQFGERVSWRGPANEFREILREVIDQLAPDDLVMAAPGYQHEDGRSAPTQKQKVRFILKARRAGSAAVTVAENSLDAASEAVATLARSTYQRSNVSTHTSTAIPEIRNLKRYVDALLGELLEIRAA